MVLTTKNEVLYLRECDVVIDVGRMIEQIAADPEYARKTIGCYKFFLLGKQETVEIGTLKLWAGRKKVSFH